MKHYNYIYIFILLSIQFSSCLTTDQKAEREVIKNEERAKTLLQEANRFFSQKNYIDAITTYENVIKLGITITRSTYNNLSKAYSEIGDYYNALKYLNEYLSIFPFLLSEYTLSSLKSLVQNYENKYIKPASFNNMGVVMVTGNISLIPSKNKYIQDYINKGVIMIMGNRGVQRSNICYPTGTHEFIFKYDDGNFSTGENTITREILSGHVYKIYAELEGQRVSFFFTDVTETELPITLNLSIPELGEKINEDIFSSGVEEDTENEVKLWSLRSLRSKINYFSHEWENIELETDKENNIISILYSEDEYRSTPINNNILFVLLAVQYYEEYKIDAIQGKIINKQNNNIIEKEAYLWKDNNKNQSTLFSYGNYSQVSTNVYKRTNNLNIQFGIPVGFIEGNTLNFIDGIPLIH